MPNRHAHPARTFRPDVEGEYDPAKNALAPHGWDMTRFLRACLRWVVTDPVGALRTLRHHDQPRPTTRSAGARTRRGDEEDTP